MNEVEMVKAMAEALGRMSVKIETLKRFVDENDNGSSYCSVSVKEIRMIMGWGPDDKDILIKALREEIGNMEVGNDSTCKA